MSSRISAAWGLTLAVLLSPLGARALEIPADLKSRLLGELGRGKTAGSPESELPDNSIDTARYLVGGGDAFQISIVGLPSMEYFPVVDASGNLYDGELGRIALGKIPLNRAQAVIAQTVRKSLRKNHDVYVALKRVKTVSVNVTGYVFNPGTYTLTGNMRLMDAIRAANGGNTPSLAHTDFRKVDVRNGDSVHTYDLLSFISGSDMDANPYIYPGDNIVLKPIDTKVFVTGEVLEPVTGAIPLKPGETVGDILDLVRLRGTADSGTITVFKAGADKNRPGPSPLPIAETRAIRLGPNDVIMVGAKQRRRRPDTVQVTGEVYRPGTYAFEPGQTTLEDILRQAGGATSYGEKERVFILRNTKKDEVLAPFGLQETPAVGLPQNLRLNQSLLTVRPEVASAVSDLKVSRDFTVLEGQAAMTKGILEDGDVIHLPRRDHFVYVSGSVRRPGAYPYKKDAGPRHYIDLAGGYSGKADTRNQFVLAVYKDVSQVREASNPRAGDILVVPAAVEYKRLSTVFLPLVQTFTTILSLTVTILVLYNNP